MSSIIVLCLLLLTAYVFDISSSKTKIPSVILLLIMGWGVKQIILFFEITVPDISYALPALGTIGLILIVLEGSLELELSKSKFPVIIKSSISAFVPVLLLSFALAYSIYYLEGVTFKTGLINAIPLAIISSAIAIPTVRHLSSHNKEFVTYESSLSDIFGVIAFNFIILNENFGVQTFGIFTFQIVLMIALSFISTIILALLLSKINHRVKFTPIIILIILIYSISKMFHLPSLLFILLFGLFMGNLDKLERFAIIRKLNPEVLVKEVDRFKELAGEMTFLIRTLFFLLFGFFIETSELLNADTIIWAIVITISIFITRALLLKILKIPMKPLLFVAPRGLITILLFLSIPMNWATEVVNKSLIVQVIVLSAFVMMYGLLKTKHVKVM